jgi:hypothetical protein
MASLRQLVQTKRLNNAKWVSGIPVLRSAHGNSPVIETASKQVFEVLADQLRRMLTGL